jgi:hypothetical protein
MSIIVNIACILSKAHQYRITFKLNCPFAYHHLNNNFPPQQFSQWFHSLDLFWLNNYTNRYYISNQQSNTNCGNIDLAVDTHWEQRQSWEKLKKGERLRKIRKIKKIREVRNSERSKKKELLPSRKRFLATARTILSFRWTRGTKKDTKKATSFELGNLRRYWETKPTGRDNTSLRAIPRLEDIWFRNSEFSTWNYPLKYST